MEVIKLNTNGITRKLKVITDCAVILITVKPNKGGRQKECTHVEVGTGSYTDHLDYEIVEEIRQKQIATITVEKKKNVRVSKKCDATSD